MQELKEQVIQEGATRIEFRCSPYYQNTAFYPVIEHLQRLLRFQTEDAPWDKRDKLEQFPDDLRIREFPVRTAVEVEAA